MLHSRRLRQTPGNQGDADGAIAPAPGIQDDAPLSDVPATVDPPDPGAPANITIVRTAQDLQRATATGAVDIEIRAHLDLRSLSRMLNPAIPGSETFQNPKKNALLYAQSPLRSIRGNCTDPDPSATLSLSAAESASLLPLRPYQCMVFFHDTFLMVNNGNLWIDNLYLRVSKQQTRPSMAFINLGRADSDPYLTSVNPGDTYVTRTTFQPDGQGTTIGITADTSDCTLMVDDCIFTDWTGFRSPFVMKYQSVFHIRDTILRNFDITSEIADVSLEGIVHFQNVSLANVSLEQGAVVSTTLNDYQFAIGYYLTYYAEDDHGFDVELEVVGPDEQSMWGEEFRIVNETMSDCVYLLAKPGLVYPGCPEESLQRRESIKRRSAGLESASVLLAGSELTTADGSFSGDYRPADAPRPASDFYYDYFAGSPEQAEIVAEYNYEYANDPGIWFAAKFLDNDDPWLVATRQVLPQHPPPPPSWPEFTVQRAPQTNRTRPTRPPVPMSPDLAQHLAAPISAVPPPDVSPTRKGSGAGLTAGEVVAVVCAVLLLATIAAAAAIVRWYARGGNTRSQKPRDVVSSAGDCEEAMLVGFTSGTDKQVSSGAIQEGGQQGQVVQEQHVQHPLHQSLHHSDVNYSTTHQSFPYFLPTSAGLVKPDSHSISDDLKPSPEGMHDLRLPEHPELIDMSTSQPSDESRQLSRDVSGNETVLGSHHLRMMQGLTGKQTDPEPAVPSAQASSELYTPESDIMGGAAAVNETQDGTIADSGTVDGTIDQSSHGSDTETESPTAASSPNPLRPAGEIQDSVAPYSNLAPTVHTAATKTTDSFSDQTIKKVLRQLDGFGKRDLLLGQYQVLGRQQQRLGGQAVVQYVRGTSDRRHYAVKFFLDPDAFFVEAALYAACFPEIQKSVSPEVAARAVDVAAASGGEGIGAIAIPAAAARFLPQVEAVCDGAAGNLIDAAGRQLPPCIVMEKGESLQDWSNRAEPDFFTVLAVLSHISLRVADMHDAGYVHRDLKPANVMWLPRENRWTVIDFGCFAGIGEVAPLSFTLAYAPPEVVEAFHTDKRLIESTPALDAWSLGVMAYELLTGSPAYNFVTHGRCRVIAQLRGELPLPWEETIGESTKHKLGAFKGPVLQLLAREPSQRVSMRRFHDICTKLFASRTTVDSDATL